MTAATPSRNGTFPYDARSAAAVYLTRGLSPIPLPPRSKDPGYQGRQRLRLTPDLIDEHFPPGQARNIAILNGELSGNVVDVDLDVREAIQAAPRLLPPRGWRFGRPTSPSSHWLYRVSQPLTSAQVPFRDLDGTMLLELRGDGGLTVVPRRAIERPARSSPGSNSTSPAK